MKEVLSQKPAFEWNAEVYHKMSDPQYELAMKLLNGLTIKGDETIIDAGCGSGRVTAKILERLPKGHVLALDYSHNMINVAKRVLSKDKDRVTIIEDDLQTFCLPKAADGIFSNCAMHFIADHKKMFKNLNRSLRPKGFLAVLFGKVDPVKQWPFLNTIMEITSKPEYKNQGLDSLDIFPKFYPSTANETKQYLADAGFIDIEVHEQKEVMRFPHTDRESGLEMMMNQTLTKLSDHKLKLKLIDEIRQAMVKHDALDGHEFEFLICKARCS